MDKKKFRKKSGIPDLERFVLKNAEKSTHLGFSWNWLISFF